MNGLDASQRAKAVLRATKTGNDNLTEAWKDNVVLDYAGVRATEMTAAQRQALLDLVALYVNNLREGHARVRMDEVRQHLDRTWFAWIGGTEPSSVFYYRIHSPVLLIEFDHQRPANLASWRPTRTLPNREHIHVVVRTPNGNDYGKDLLRQHYATHPHSRRGGVRGLGLRFWGLRLRLERENRNDVGHLIDCRTGTRAGGLRDANCWARWRC